MGSAVRVPLGAPGVYYDTEVPLRALTGERMDVCAFVGVAPRGPVRVPVVNETWRDDVPCVEPERPRRRTLPVAIESFDEYRQLYGAFSGPGLLPYAVASFFEQGGRRAYIARIVHEYGNDTDNNARVAAGVVGGAITTAGSLRLQARNEGSWGNGLTASIAFRYEPLSFDSATAAELEFPADIKVPAGTLLRLTLPLGVQRYRFLTAIALDGSPGRPEVLQHATLSAPLAEAPVSAEVVDGELSLSDGDGRMETHSHLGLSSLHPLWMATVLCNESSLVYPDTSWRDAEVTPDEGAAAEPFAGGEDDYRNITHEDFFDSGWTLGGEEPGGGVHSLTHLRDLSLVVVPDLYSPAPLAASESIGDPSSLAGPTFAKCVDFPPPAEEQEDAVADLQGLLLDPGVPADFEQIIQLQLRLEKLAVQLRSFVVLLDVPPGVHQSQILRWRAQFRSSYEAAYLPWLKVARRDDSRDVLIRVPPSALAAGIIAQMENLFGVSHGPANALAAEVVDVSDRISPERHDSLHPLGLNVFMPERDGIRLTAARTLSRDQSFRQLNVRRLMTMLQRTLDRQMQWLVFESNNAALRAEVRKLLNGFLRKLFRAGAFRGATEEEAFFVKCDDELNPLAVTDAGRLIAHVGVAPAEPLEFIVVRLSRTGDGTLTVEE